jgi:hypothetical protein
METNEILIGKKFNSNLFFKSGTLIDFKNNLFKSFTKVFGINSGTWNKLPKLDYILVFKTLYVKCEGCSLDDFENNQNAVFQVSLVYNKNRKIIVHESKSKLDVFSMANLLSEKLRIRIKDSASDRRNPKWLS